MQCGTPPTPCLIVDKNVLRKIPRHSSMYPPTTSWPFSTQPYTAAPSPPPITRADTDYLSGAIKKYTDADEILRAALDASKKTRSPSCGGESGEPSKSGGTYSSVSVQEASVENTPRKENCCGLLTATTKKRRCGAVRLAGTATQKGFCATSLSQR